MCTRLFSCINPFYVAATYHNQADKTLQKYKRSGRREDLEDAIERYRLAYDAGTSYEDHRDYTTIIMNYASALDSYNQTFAETPRPQEVIKLLCQARGIMERQERKLKTYATLLNNLGQIYLDQYRKHGTHHQDAADAFEHALSLHSSSSGSILYSKSLIGSAAVILAACELASQGQAGDIAALEIAEEYLNRALKRQEYHENIKIECFRYLGSVYCLLHQRTGDDEYVEMSIENHEKAIKLLRSNTPLAPPILINLAQQYLTRYTLKGEGADLIEAELKKDEAKELLLRGHGSQELLDHITNLTNAISSTKRPSVASNSGLNGRDTRSKSPVAVSVRPQIVRHGQCNLARDDARDSFSATTGGGQNQSSTTSAHRTRMIGTSQLLAVPRSAYGTNGTDYYPGQDQALVQQSAVGQPPQPAQLSHRRSGQLRKKREFTVSDQPLSGVELHPYQYKDQRVAQQQPPNMKYPACRDGVPASNHNDHYPGQDHPLEQHFAVGQPPPRAVHPFRHGNEQPPRFTGGKQQHPPAVDPYLYRDQREEQQQPPDVMDATRQGGVPESGYYYLDQDQPLEQHSAVGLPPPPPHMDRLTHGGRQRRRVTVGKQLPSAVESHPHKYRDQRRVARQQPPDLGYAACQDGTRASEDISYTKQTPQLQTTGQNPPPHSGDQFWEQDQTFAAKDSPPTMEDLGFNSGQEMWRQLPPQVTYAPPQL